MKRIRLLIALLFIALLFGCATNGASSKKMTAFQPTQKVKTTATLDDDDTPEFADVGPLQLQARLMSYADTYNSRVIEAAAIIETIGTPQARLTAARMRVFDISSNVEIAAGPYPGVALLDMLVMSSMRRMVWEEFWVPRFGDAAKPALEFYKEAEEDLWESSAKVLSHKQLNALAAVIVKWRKKNPKQVGVNYIRFDDFEELGLKPSIQGLMEPGGLFSSVQQAAMVAQEMKVAIDRAFYLMSRMQLIITFQIKLAYLEMLFEPEADGIVNTADRVTSISERYAEIAEKLPQELRKETTILMTEMFAGLSQNSNNTITHALEGMTAWQQTTVNDIMRNVSVERQAAIDQAIQGITKQQDDIYNHVESLVDRSGEELQETINHAFMLGIGLIVIFFICLTLYKVLIARPIDK